MKNIVERLKDVVSNELSVEKRDIVSGASIRDSFGADELDFVTLIMAVEEEFGFAIPDEDAERIETFGELVRYVERNSKK